MAGAAALVSAQAVQTPAPGAVDEGLAQMQRRIVGVVEAIIDYTRDVRLSEPGLEAVLEHHASINEIYDDGAGSRLVERAFVDGRYDFGVIVADPAYVEWCQARGLEPEGFFRELLRLQALRMREESLAGLDRGPRGAARAAGGARGVARRDGRGQYAGALASLESAAAMVEETRTLMEGLPVPTVEEAALLAKHEERIAETLGEAPE